MATKKKKSNPRRKTSKISGAITDNSGKVISLADYVMLHGDPPVNYENLPPMPTNRLIPKTNIFKHIANSKDTVKPKSRKNKKVKCKFCQLYIYRDEIREHNLLNHPNESHLEHNPALTAKKGKGNFSDNQPLAPAGQEGNIAEKLKQALDESRYGGKGMHIRHEGDGKFGSTPLHDDYGDESDSE